MLTALLVAAVAALLLPAHAAPSRTGYIPQYVPEVCGEMELHGWVCCTAHVLIHRVSHAQPVCCTPRL